ncbi:KEN domain-containing protein [Artemisia annua]|uniref:KEN domain-containing protein n=1 Tax=Artemisia annua TaxID=35608 RepID=A0A2U1NPM7_ARTAN|nr:KEN domain-containing protein [Artemisia annua]
MDGLVEVDGKTLTYFSLNSKKDTAVGVTLDGTISLVYHDSLKNIWSFPTGSPIYSSYQAPINHTNDMEIASASEGSYFVDIGNDWKLHVHTNSSQVASFCDINIDHFDLWP